MTPEYSIFLGREVQIHDPVSETVLVIPTFGGFKLKSDLGKVLILLANGFVTEYKAERCLSIYGLIHHIILS